MAVGEINSLRLDDIAPLTELMTHSFINQKTGMGTGRSNFQNVEVIKPTRINFEQENWIYSGNGFIQNVCNLLPVECADDWITYHQGKGGIQVDDKLLNYLDTGLIDHTITGLGIKECFERASRQARKHGDCFAVMFIADERETYEPVDYKNIHSFDGLFLVNRQKVQPEQFWLGDPTNPLYYRVFYHQSEYRPHYGQVEAELPTNFKGSMIWHRSRILRFPGTPPDDDAIASNGGYNDSQLQAIINAFVYWQQGVMAGADMLHNYNQGVLKSEDLLELIHEDAKTGTNINTKAIKERLLTAQMGMSVLKDLLIDKNREDYSFISRNYSGADKILDSLEKSLSACLDIPTFKAFKQVNAQGLATANTAGLAQRFEWLPYKQRFVRNYWIRPFIYVAKLVSLAQNTSFSPLPENAEFMSASKVLLTQTEEAGIRKKMADTDKIYLDAGVYFPQEARQRIATSEFRLDLFLDEEIPEKEQKKQELKEQPIAPESDLVSEGIEEQKEEKKERRSDNLRNDTIEKVGILSDRAWDELANISAAEFVTIAQDITLADQFNQDALNMDACAVPLQDPATGRFQGCAVGGGNPGGGGGGGGKKSKGGSGGGGNPSVAASKPTEKTKTTKTTKTTQKAKSGGGEATKAVDASDLNKLKLKDLKAIAEKEGIEKPAKYANRKASWIAEIEKAKGKKPEGTTKPKVTKPKATKPKAEANDLSKLKLKDLKAIAEKEGIEKPAKYVNRKASWIAEIEKAKGKKPEGATKPKATKPKVEVNDLSKLKLKDLKAIAEKEGIEKPAKYVNRKASWIAEIEKAKGKKSEGTTKPKATKPAEKKATSEKKPAEKKVTSEKFEPWEDGKLGISDRKDRNREMMAAAKSPLPLSPLNKAEISDMRKMNDRLVEIADTGGSGKVSQADKKYLKSIGVNENEASVWTRAISLMEAQTPNAIKTTLSSNTLTYAKNLTGKYGEFYNRQIGEKLSKLGNKDLAEIASKHSMGVVKAGAPLKAKSLEAAPSVLTTELKRRGMLDTDHPNGSFKGKIITDWGSLKDDDFTFNKGTKKAKKPEPKGSHDDFSIFRTERIDQLSDRLGISKDEAEKVHKSISNWTKVGYENVKNHQRGKADPLGEKITKDLDKILYSDNISPYKGSLYRGITFRSKKDRDSFIQKTHTEGIELKNHSSFSSSGKVAVGFANGESSMREEAPAAIVRVIDNKKGKSIKQFSTLKDEDEVVVPIGTKYKLINSQKKTLTSDKIVDIIDVEEID